MTSSTAAWVSDGPYRARIEGLVVIVSTPSSSMTTATTITLATDNFADVVNQLRHEEALKRFAGKKVSFFPDESRGLRHLAPVHRAPHVVPNEYNRAMRARWVR